MLPPAIESPDQRGHAPGKSHEHDCGHKEKAVDKSCGSQLVEPVGAHHHRVGKTHHNHPQLSHENRHAKSQQAQVRLQIGFRREFTDYSFHPRLHDWFRLQS